MQFIKHHLCDLPYCYAVGTVPVKGRTNYIFATDDTGPCYAIDAQTGQCETVWDGPGGTMSIVPLPGQDGAFLASQRFMPGFAALHARIVKLVHTDAGWTVTPWLELPYVHRFDILERNGSFYFLGCILSSTEEEQAQWEAPGYLVAAPLNADFDPPAHLEMIAQDMPRNHGYCRVDRPQYTQAYVASDSGVFVLTPPPAPSEPWEIRQLLTAPASDVAVCDIDEDGVEELATIEPFHGDAFVLYHADGTSYREVYRYHKPAPFLHAIWGGTLRGKPVFLAGCREADCEFFLVSHSEAGYTAQVIESGFGPSNVTVISGQEQDTILIANRQSHEGAVFFVKEDRP